MSGPDIDPEFLCHMIPQGGLGQHALNRFCQQDRRVFSEDVLCRRGLEPTGETGVVAIQFRGHLVTGQMDLLGIYDHDMVAHIDMGSKGWPVFAAQHSGDAGCQSAQRFPLGIHEIPLFLHV